MKSGIAFGVCAQVLFSFGVDLRTKFRAEELARTKCKYCCRTASQVAWARGYGGKACAECMRMMRRIMIGSSAEKRAQQSLRSSGSWPRIESCPPSKVVG